MSQLQVNRINDASGGVLAPISSVMRNRIINGAMTISQRNGTSSITPTTDGEYTLDRWGASLTQASKFSVQQDAGAVTPPVGFVDYLGATSLSAYSVLTNDYFLLQQKIEGFNVSDLGWGTASAKTVTLSFWARSSLTGTFGGSLSNSAINRSYPFTYTISSANTWEYKTITIAGDTSGTWLTTNGIGLRVILSLGAGSGQSGTAGAWAGSQFLSATGATSVVGTNGATFYITGVQLEVGTQATSFEYRQYGTELALCQRYFERFNYPSGNVRPVTTGQLYNTTGVHAPFSYSVKRAAPTVTGSAASHFACYLGTTLVQSTTILYVAATVNSVNINPNSLVSAGTTNDATLIVSNDTAASVAFIDVSSEL